MSTIARSQTAQSRNVLPAGTWQLDPAHSQVGFAVDYLVGTFRGSFSPVRATLEVAEDGAATLTGAVRVADVKVQDENLGAHLQSPDFFDAERTPELTFRSTEVRRDGDDVTVRGELTIREHVEPVELRGTLAEPIEDPFGNERIGLTLSGAVDRTRFGIDWNNPLPSGEPALANVVTLTGELFFVKAA
jgi:polyisoprenoid-binding protein YceI